MKSGDLVVCRPSAWRSESVLGIIIRERVGIAIDTRFFDVFIPGSGAKLIPETYLNQLGAP